MTSIKELDYKNRLLHGLNRRFPDRNYLVALIQKEGELVIQVRTNDVELKEFLPSKTNGIPIIVEPLLGLI